MSEQKREYNREDLPPDAELDALQLAKAAYDKGNIVKEMKVKLRDDLATEQFKSVVLDNKITRISMADFPPKGKPGATAPPDEAGNGQVVDSKVPAVQDSNEAERNQYLVALATVTLSSLWITWFGVEMPKEVYAAIPAIFVVGGQFFATRFNNRKAK